MALPEHLKIGARGEQLAARYLREQGYAIYASDFETNLGETDIIAIAKDRTLCFIEVKTRTPGGMFPPAEAVDSAKQRNLISNAAAFLKRKEVEHKAVRFDIIEVILSDLYHAEINHIKNAFGQDEVS